MNLYLIRYDRQTSQGEVVRCYRDDEHEAAAAALLELELTKPAHIEVVILEADSEEAIRETHGRYFKTLRELALGA